MRSLVLLRHGESTWNREGRFTGWTDVGLTDRGLAQAAATAAALLAHGYLFDVAFTSVLKRAIKTLWVVLEGMDRMWIPVHRSWRLNERHYGSAAIEPELARGKRVLVSAHGNSLRALVKHLDRLSEAEIVHLDIPVAVPLVYEIDAQLEPIRRFYLADPDAVAAAIHAVAEEARRLPGVG